MFLSAEYREIYGRSKKRAESTLGGVVGKLGAADEQQGKAAAKTYKQKWLQDKLAAQLESKKKKRRDGKDKEQEKAGADARGQAGAAKGTRGKAKKADADKKMEIAELEQVIDDMKNERVWKDEEFNALRRELEAVRKETEFLRQAYKEEKVKRQALEASKTKSILLKELMANAPTIQEGSYLDRVRDQDKTRNTSGNLMNQLLEQKKNSHKAALAAKYGARWIVRTQKARDHKEHERVFHA